jgi:hypothetical protein
VAESDPDDTLLIEGNVFSDLEYGGAGPTESACIMLSDGVEPISGKVVIRNNVLTDIRGNDDDNHRAIRCRGMAATARVIIDGNTIVGSDADYMRTAIRTDGGAAGAQVHIGRNHLLGFVTEYDDDDSSMVFDRSDRWSAGSTVEGLDVAGTGVADLMAWAGDRFAIGSDDADLDGVDLVGGAAGTVTVSVGSVLGMTFSTTACAASLPIALPSYTVAQLLAGTPPATTAGCKVWCSDHFGGAREAYSDGTDWRDTRTGLVVS